MVDIGVTLYSQEEAVQVIDRAHAGTQVDGPAAGPLLVLSGKHVTVARVGGHREVEQPSLTKYPVVAITQHQAIIIIQEMRHLDILGQIVAHHLRKLIGIKTHVAVLQADARDKGASTAFLVLGETIGRGLGITSVIEKVVCTHAVGLALHAAEVTDGALVFLVARLPIGEDGLARVFHIISIGREPRTGERVTRIKNF